MQIFVGIHTKDDLTGVSVGLGGLARFGQLGILDTAVRLPTRLGSGWPSPGRSGSQNCDGALFTARPLSGHA